MAFISKTDFQMAIRNNILDEVTNSDDNKVSEAIKYAIDYVRGYLSNRYDTINIFNKTGDDRNQTVRGICVDVAIHQLHKSINPRKIPTHRKDAYQDAKQWLLDVSEGMINPPDLPKPVDGSKSSVIFGGNPRRNNQT